jgi:hypothetical protein
MNSTSYDWQPSTVGEVAARSMRQPIDDEDALREFLDCAVAPPQVREEILKAARTGRHARQLGSGAERTESRAGRPARRPRLRSG